MCDGGEGRGSQGDWPESATMDAENLLRGVGSNPRSFLHVGQEGIQEGRGLLKMEGGERKGKWNDSKFTVKPNPIIYTSVLNA